MGRRSRSQRERQLLLSFGIDPDDERWLEWSDPDRYVPKVIDFGPEPPDDPEARAAGRVRSAEIRVALDAYLAR